MANVLQKGLPHADGVPLGRVEFHGFWSRGPDLKVLVQVSAQLLASSLSPSPPLASSSWLRGHGAVWL